jgi:hypothetical protein
MEKFAPPDGVTNPGEGPIQAYGGTLLGDKLVQIGGGQDNSGGTQVQGGVAVPSSPQVIATGSFEAPSEVGEYTVSLENPVGNVFTEVNAPPAISLVDAASLGTTGDESFTFTVSAAGCQCGDIDQSGGQVNLGDFATFAVCYGFTTPNPPGCDAAAFACSDMDANNIVDLNDFATFATFYGLDDTYTVPNCVLP